MRRRRGARRAACDGARRVRELVVRRPPSRRRGVERAACAVRAAGGPDGRDAFRYLQPSFAPAGFDEPDDKGTPTCHHFRPTDLRRDDADDGHENAAAPPSLAELPARTTVYATLGTVYNGPDLLAAIIDGLENEELNLVVSVGATHDPTTSGRRPPNVHIERWIRQHVVLRRCAALGVGLLVRPDDRTPTAIRGATRAVLGDPRYRRAAERVARASHRRPGLDDALDLLETLARNRVPLLVRRRRGAVGA